jgi:hypothetical protein
MQSAARSRAKEEAAQRVELAGVAPRHCEMWRALVYNIPIFHRSDST